MKAAIRALLIFALAFSAMAQRSREQDRPMRRAVRGTRGAVAAGLDPATDAGMRLYYAGGNAVDAGLAAMFASAICEFSHFGFGGEAPILIRTKDGKVHSIAGVGTMPKAATADFFRSRRLLAGEVTNLEPNGLKGFVPVWPNSPSGMISCTILPPPPSNVLTSS